jgi:hypothetical protein
VICPRCTFHQPDAEECARCGLVVAKWNPDHAPRSQVRPPSASPARSRSSRRATSLGAAVAGVVLLAGGGVGAAAWYMRPPPVEDVLTPVDDAVREQVDSLQKDASELGCPRAIKTTSSIAEQAAADPAPPGWVSNAAGWARATSGEHAADQPLVVYFGVPWCKYASAFERDTLGDPAVRARLSSLARVRINPEAGDTEARVADDFGVRVYPTVVLVAADGKRTRIQVLRDVDTQIMLGKPNDFVFAIDQGLGGKVGAGSFVP